MNGPLYHFTCDHGRLGLGDGGMLLPPKRLIRQLPVVPSWQRRMFDLIWMTDLERPNRDGLGLTSYSLGCDRTQYRYRVTQTVAVDRWFDVRRDFPAKYRDELEWNTGALPAHWFVASMPVPVVFDPVNAAWLNADLTDNCQPGAAQ